ncbi:hypothetical protein [Rhizobium leguminosarum]|uniref:Uncharacterized protein n=1 Tax=Rhizobium leguminosarum TaxID=384 RepID=A0A7K3VK41_RHILE|nr:hypothetical protein [Rhizobium leguminosarum]NEK17204.1 hypothetical protein [Rhizobium leguminosarum]NEK37312.1 hypothetical protein [Rhizobium leguminosarum]
MGKQAPKNVGPGRSGKGYGSGAMTDLTADEVPENAVLSNRDKARHSKERGLDSKRVETEQLRDHGANRDPA